MSNTFDDLLNSPPSLTNWKIDPSVQLARDLEARKVKDAEFERGEYLNGEAGYLAEKEVDDKRIAKLKAQGAVVTNKTNTFDSLETNTFDSLETPPKNTFDSIEEPGYGQLFEQGLNQVGANINRFGALVSSALPGVSESVPNYFQKQAEALEDPAAAGMSPEQAANTENLPFMKRAASFAGGAAGFAPAMLAGPVGVAIMTGVQSGGQKAREVAQGAEPWAAMVATIPDTVINGAANILPFGASTVARAGVTGAWTNMASGFITDAINKGVYYFANDKTHENYHPLDFQQRLLEGLFGGVLGAGGKAVESKVYNKQRGEALRDLLDESIRRLEQDMGHIANQADWSGYDFSAYKQIADHNFANGTGQEKFKEMWRLVLEDLASNQFPDKDGNPVAPDQKFRVLLDFASKFANPNVKDGIDLREQARYIKSLYSLLEMAGSDFDIITDPSLGGQWAAFKQKLELNPNYPSFQNLLHEAQHVLTSKLIYTVTDPIVSSQRISPNGPSRLEILESTPHGKNIAEQIRLLDKLFNTFEAEINTHTDPNKIRTYYGLSNLMEFLSELNSSDEFRNVVKKVKVMASDAQAFVKPNSMPPSLRKVFSENNPVFNKETNVYELAMRLAANLYHEISWGGKEGNGSRATQTKQAMEAQFGKDKDIEDIVHQVAGNDADELVQRHFSDYVLRKIGQLAARSQDPETFGIKLDSMFPSEAWRNFLTGGGGYQTNAQKIWDNRAFYTKLYEDFVISDSNAKKMGMSEDPRTIDHIFDSLFKGRMPSAGDDITSGGTYLNTQDALSMIKDKTLGGQLLRAFNDKINEYVSLKAQLYANFLAFQDKFNKLKTDEQINVMAAAAIFNTLEFRKILEQNGLWWPDDAMLRRQGLSDVEMEAYKDIADGYDYMYKVLNSAAKNDTKGINKDGNFELARIPGYMPHFHDGKVKVFFKAPDANGNMVMFIRGFNHIFQAERFAKELRRRNVPGLELVPQQVPGKGAQDYIVQKNRSPAEGITPTLVQHYQAWKDMSRLDPNTQKVISDLDAIAARGWNKSLMQNHNVGGFIGDPNNPYRKAMKSFLGLPNKEASALFDIYDRYAKSVAEFAGNSYFVKDVYDVLLQHRSPDFPEGRGEMMSNMENLTQYVTEQTRNFTGENVNKLSMVDEFLEKLGIASKLHPWVVRDFVRFARNLMTTVRLRNPRNWWANLQQPLNGVGMLYHFAHEFGLLPPDGSKSQSPMKSLAWAYREMTYDMSNEGKFALDWARSKHVVDPQQDDEVPLSKGILHGARGLANKLAFSTINPSIEGFGREATFLMSYHFFKQFYNNKIDALGAAERATRSIMVNYNRANRPLMYQNLGVVGEAISPFAVYRNQYLGNTYLMLRDIARNPGKAAAWRPLLVAQGIYLFMAGALGIIGIQEYNLFVEYYNKYMPDEWALPRAEELAMSMGAPDWLTFGVASEMTKSLPGTPEGFYLGQSSNAPSMAGSLEPPIIPVMQALISFGLIPWDEGKRLLGMGPGTDMDKLYKSLKAVTPVQLHPWIEESLAADNGVVPRASSREGYVEGSESGKLSKLAYGAEGIDQWKQKRANELVNRRTMKMDEVVHTYVEKAADFALNVPLGMHSDEAFEKAVQANPILTREEFEAQVIQEIESRLTTASQRDIKAGSSKSKYKQQLREMYGR